MHFAGRTLAIMRADRGGRGDAVRSILELVQHGGVQVGFRVPRPWRTLLP